MKNQEINSPRILLFGRPTDLAALIDLSEISDQELPVKIKNVYLKNTKKYVTKQLAEYEKIFKVKAKEVRFINSPSSWGTCNSKKEITFHYQLSMLPEKVMDYVILHEVCHLLHLNHDRSFWRKIGSIDPEYKQKINYLDTQSPFHFTL